MNTRPITISTLSPLHIGCDEVFDPSQFVIADHALHVLDPEVLAAALDENERRHLVKIASGPDPIGPIQHFFKSRRNHLAPLATTIIDVASDIAKDYEERAGEVQARSRDGHRIYNLFPMARTAFNPVDGSVYVPGSSIKGSLRTAWLNHLNRGEPLNDQEKNAKDGAARLQHRLLGYAPGKFENDPFRHVHVADAHADPGGIPPPTRIAYAVSKKKRESERGSPELLRVLLEMVRESLPAAFVGELRLGRGDIDWDQLCDACNAFYGPQLDDEIDHARFGPLLASEWRRVLSRLLHGEMRELMDARQGFLLRVGRHSGAESLTLDGVRSIKILGANGHSSTLRPTTTEKRFASATRAGNDNLLPFGWLWVESCDDAHQYLAIAVRDALARLSAPVRESHAERLAEIDRRLEMRRETAIAAAKAAAAAQERALQEQRAEEERAAALAAMSPARRQIEEFIATLRERFERYPGNKENANAVLHGKARALAKAALEEESWTAEEKRAAADAIEEWLPKAVKIDIKDERKKLKLNALRGG